MAQRAPMVKRSTCPVRYKLSHETRCSLSWALPATRRRHVFYETPERHRAFIEQFDDSLRPLAADCYNAVVDVADETRFEQRFPLARKYFASSTTQAATRRSGITGHLRFAQQTTYWLPQFLGLRSDVCVTILGAAQSQLPREMNWSVNAS